MIAAAGLVASCSTTKLAQNTANDDVYNSVAKAIEVEPYVPPREQMQTQNQSDYDEYYGTSNPYYDMDYSSRINRFYNGNSFRGYYDPYYDNYYYGNSYGATSYLGYGGLGWGNGYGLGGWGGGFGMGFGYGSIWNNPFYYGNMGFGWNNWGPYSYYDRFGWGGGGWYGGGWGLGGGYYGGGIITNNNYRPRPGSNDRGVPGNYGNGTAGNYGRPSRSGVVSGNGQGRQSYVPNNNAGRPMRNQQSGGNNGYTPQGSQGSRPTRNESYSPPQRTESRPSYSPPPSSSGSGSMGGGGGGGSRPSRAGRG